MNKLVENIELIKSQIEPYTPKIVAVTKYFDENAIIEYHKAGFRDFGENRVQDALAKMEKLPAEILADSRFHLIGHLQSRKVKSIIGKFDLIHSVDSLKLAKIIDEEAKKQKIVQKILLQVNNANEEQKYGFSTNDLKACFKEITELKNINVLGLMNIAPLTQDQKLLHSLFANIKHLKDELASEFKVELNEISMGMSNDFKIALEEGSTIIRLGRILFK
ncbi:MAG: YggS family pyridoxal phosphate-dependent enzyme [Candidatus Gastranaerophilales bacterium]|nr:YggS family pyridoxal phosphate-dependent enzyme [Candidatus Gastranaerophilales bacterium]